MNKIIFDLDDTLCNTYNIYNSRLIWAYHWSKNHGFAGSEKVFRKIFQKIDIEGLRKDGAITKTRFGCTICDTVSFAIGRDLSPKEKKAIDMVASSFKDEVPVLFPETNGVLSALREDGFTLFLYTSGETEMQRTKIEKLGIGNFFEKIVVTPLKTEETLRSNFPNREATIVIGNSPKFDLIPAIRNAMPAIQVEETPMWKFDHAHLPSGVTVPKVRLADVPNTVYAIAGSLSSHEVLS